MRSIEMFIYLMLLSVLMSMFFVIRFLKDIVNKLIAANNFYNQ